MVVQVAGRVRTRLSWGVQGVWVGWRAAMKAALYGEGGLYRGEGAAARHFRTSVVASSRFGAALATLLSDIDRAPDGPDELDVVDVGAGSGLLLTGIRDCVPPQVRRRLRLSGVEKGPRPPELPADIGWGDEMPDGVTGLVVANEWLDNVPVDVVELSEDGPRLVEVDTGTGEERLGGEPSHEDRAWLDTWWPLKEVGERAEVGWPRDEAWAGLVRRLDHGVAVAVDYGHYKDARPAYGSLTGYRSGRQVAPVPDGSCDITAHVALDACAARTGSRLTTQRDALRALGVTAGRPPVGMATTDPHGYLHSLQRAGEEGELIDPDGLGGFGWLVHAKGVTMPPALRGTMSR